MNKTHLQINLATSEDIEELIITYEEARIYKHSLGDDIWGTKPFTSAEISKMVRQNNTYTVKLGSQHVGAFVLTWEDSRNWGKNIGNDKQAGYIHLFATRDISRGLGIGQKMIRWISKRIQQEGRSYVRLDCSSENRALCKYYKQQGFKEVGRNKGVYPAALYEKPVEKIINFSGAKIALITPDQKILVYLRDNKPALYMANKWDLPGGGKEGSETPKETILREIKEELGINLLPSQITYTASYESERFLGTLSLFMVGKISKEQISRINFGSEGQKYQFMSIEKYLSLHNAVPHLQKRFKEYLDTQKIALKGD